MVWTFVQFPRGRGDRGGTWQGRFANRLYRARRIRRAETEIMDTAVETRMALEVRAT